MPRIRDASREARSVTDLCNPQRGAFHSSSSARWPMYFNPGVKYSIPHSETLSPSFSLDSPKRRRLTSCLSAEPVARHQPLLRRRPPRIIDSYSTRVQRSRRSLFGSSFKPRDCLRALVDRLKLQSHVASRKRERERGRIKIGWGGGGGDGGEAHDVFRSCFLIDDVDDDDPIRPIGPRIFKDDTGMMTVAAAATTDESDARARAR